MIQIPHLFMLNNFDTLTPEIDGNGNYDAGNLPGNVPAGTGTNFLNYREGRERAGTRHRLRSISDSDLRPSKR